MPIHRNGNKFEFNTVISGINKYYFRHDDIERPNTYFYHYLSREFDDIVEQYKKNNENLDDLSIIQLFHANKDNLSDLSWFLVRFDM
jgi:hypothetical protein